jgi:hypothetical protein
LCLLSSVVLPKSVARLFAGGKLAFEAAHGRKHQKGKKDDDGETQKEFEEIRRENLPHD